LGPILLQAISLKTGDLAVVAIGRDRDGTATIVMLDEGQGITPIDGHQPLQLQGASGTIRHEKVFEHRQPLFAWGFPA
jgi:hypothetical protein